MGLHQKRSPKFKMLHTPLPIRENLYAPEPAYGRSRQFVAGGKKVFCCIAIMTLLAFSDIFGYVERQNAQLKQQVTVVVAKQATTTSNSQLAIQYRFYSAFEQEQVLTTIPPNASTVHYCYELEAFEEGCVEDELREL